MLRACHVSLAGVQYDFWLILGTAPKDSKTVEKNFAVHFASFDEKSGFRMIKSLAAAETNQ